MIDILKKRAIRNVVANFDVKKVRKEREGWVISNGQEEKVYDKVISTMPIYALIKAMDAPKDVRDAVNDLKHNSLISVMLGLNVKKINDLSWLYIPDETCLAHRVSFPSNCSPYVAPQGKSSVLAEITSKEGDETWQMKDGDIIRRAVDDLHRLHILNKNSVCFASAKRSLYAYVISDMNCKKNLAIVKSYVKEVGIDLLGRFSEFKYLNMDACVENALKYVNIQCKSS